MKNKLQKINNLSLLYKKNVKFYPKTSYVLMNFSKSPTANECHSLLLNCLNASIANFYEFKDQSSLQITIEDFLPWSLCGLNVPIIYFADNIACISNNQRWFVHRTGKGDIIADGKGNLLLTDRITSIKAMNTYMSVPGILMS